MEYEEKRKQVGIEVINAIKFARKGYNPSINSKKQSLKDITCNELESLLYQFQDDNKLKVIDKKFNGLAFELLEQSEPKSGYTFVIEVIDIEYFKQFLPKPSPMKDIIDFQEYLTGQTAEERARIRAIENSYKQPKEIVKTIKEPNDIFFIEFKDDGVIKLNGKIDIGKPEFNGTNEAIFIFLFNNPNKSFTKTEVIEGAKIKSIQDFHKVVENLGFRRGLKKAFFDINKGSIKFKNPVTL